MTSDICPSVLRVNPSTESLGIQEPKRENTPMKVNPIKVITPDTIIGVHAKNAVIVAAATKRARGARAVAAQAV